MNVVAFKFCIFVVVVVVVVVVCLFVCLFHYYPVTNLEVSFRSTLVLPTCPVTEDFTCPKIAIKQKK